MNQKDRLVTTRRKTISRIDVVDYVFITTSFVDFDF